MAGIEKKNPGFLTSVWFLPKQTSIVKNTTGKKMAASLMGWGWGRGRYVLFQ